MGVAERKVGPDRIPGEGCGTFLVRFESAKSALIQKRHRLDASHLKALAAADVLAHDHIVAADHVRLRLGELCAVALVGTSGELLLLGPHQP